MSALGKFRFVSSDRRVREDRRFVVGKGKFAADIVLPGAKHVALVTCPHPPRASSRSTSRAALAMPGVHYVLDGAELAGATNAAAAAGLDTPNVPRCPLALDVARYAGEWVVAVVADSRALAEDAAEAVAIEYEPLPFVLDAEEAYSRRHAGARGARLQRAARPHLRLGRGRQGFRRRARTRSSYRVQMGPQLHRADRDLRRDRELGPVARDPRRLGFDPDAEVSRPDRRWR